MYLILTVSAAASPMSNAAQPTGASLLCDEANPFLVNTAVLDRYEVCSPGEFAICERLGIPMSKIVLSGVYKEKLSCAGSLLPMAKR